MHQGGSVAVAIVPWTLLMLFNTCWLRYFYNCMCMEFGVSLRLLWHVPGSQRRLLAVMDLTLQFQIPSLLGTVCLNILWAHVKSIVKTFMHMNFNPIIPMNFNTHLGLVIVWLSWVFLPGFAGFQSLLKFILNFNPYLNHS